MTYKEISGKIKSCKSEADLYNILPLIEEYKATSGDTEGTVKLQLQHKNMSRKLAKPDTYTRLNY